ncbi:DUF488 family protein [Oscillatoria sp. HE19RPO]|uniref:DUF488 domain-containing protein n=1 Tax=Oscillatoria sp. HE19RPO TaxID=2954806 RepID=UPI0020C426AC|nr:DUF488 domain-containing protein [Oscillatoria sp. HE19RPO]
MQLFTIGHSNHEIDTFIQLLQQHQIDALADVRSHPYSRYLPHFNRTLLKESLEKAGIKYVFLGQELGARPSNPDCYIEGKALYEKIAATPDFQAGLNRVLNGLNTHKISLMCAEQDPLTCHRAILVCQHLRQHNLEINHILKTGQLEPHHDLEERMLVKQGLSEYQNNPNNQPIQLSLFSEPNNDLPTREDCLKTAYQLQGDQIAYIEKTTENDEQ